MIRIIYFGLEWDEERIIISICIIHHGIRESFLSSSPNLRLDLALFLGICISLAFSPLLSAPGFNMRIADWAFYVGTSHVVMDPGLVKREPVSLCQWRQAQFWWPRETVRKWQYNWWLSLSRLRSEKKIGFVSSSVRLSSSSIFTLFFLLPSFTYSSTKPTFITRFRHDSYWCCCC